VKQLLAFFLTAGLAVLKLKAQAGSPPSTQLCSGGTDLRLELFTAHQCAHSS
jgi:hypothetical protein